MAKTLAEKVWDAHVVRKGDGEGANAQPDLLFIDLHLVHEVTSPQAFEGLRLAGRKLRRPDLTIATEDHNTPTLDIDKPIADLTSRTQIQTLRNNCQEFGVRLHSLGDAEQGIVRAFRLFQQTPGIAQAALGAARRPVRRPAAMDCGVPRRDGGSARPPSRLRRGRC